MALEEHEALPDLGAFMNLIHLRTFCPRQVLAAAVYVSWKHRSRYEGTVDGPREGGRWKVETGDWDSYPPGKHLLRGENSIFTVENDSLIVILGNCGCPPLHPLP